MDNKTLKVGPITLEPYQIDHFLRIKEILSKQYFYQDGSEQGTGKTHVTAAVAFYLNLPVIAVCPTSVRHVWIEVLNEYKIPICKLPGVSGGVITYDGLRSKKGIQPAHELLTRENGTNGVEFSATPKLVELFKSGVLIIFDESQKIKNNGAQSKAARTIMETLYTVGGTSRVAFLSGTPIDDTKQVINFLRRVRFIRSPRLYSKIKGETRLEGVQELKVWAKRIDPEAAEKFFRENPYFVSTHKGSMEYVYQLFLKVIKPKVMSIMPNPLGSRKKIKNGFYKMSPEDEAEYAKYIQKLANAVRYNPDNNQIVRTFGGMGCITESIIGIQKSKINSMVRVAKRDLNSNKNYKVIIYAGYYVVIDKLLEELKEFNPVEITGQVKEDKRVENIKLFQQPNNNCRVMIGNAKAGGLGINLHDWDGDFPRRMYIFPDYHINELIQASSRTTRPGMIGDSYVRLFYGLAGATEKAIMDSLSRKGSVMKEVTIEQTESGTLFPDEFENEMETDEFELETDNEK